MPTSAAGSKRRQAGLTLVEVLAVIALAAVLTAVVIQTVPSGTSDAEVAAKRFAREVAGLSDGAIVSGRTAGLSADPGLSVHAFDDAGDGWTVTRTLGEVPSDAGVRVTLTPQGEVLAPDPVPTGTLVIYRPPGEEPEEEAPAPPVLFGPTGEVTPFVAVFEDDDEAWTVTVGPFGETAVSDAR